jgi:phosphatidylcholine synthase
LRRILAWGVHLFTAVGAVLGAWALLAVDAAQWRTALLLLFAAFLVDCFDGMLARAVGVAEVLPDFDGRRLDDMVDYLNYVVVPAVFLVAGGWLPHWGWAAPPILASAYGFSQREAKTSDDFFLGFPSYWNVVAFYAWAWQTPAWVCTTAVVILSVGVFVPFKYLYPSRMQGWRKTMVVLASVSAGSAIALLVDPDWARARQLHWLSFVFPAWYLAFSFWMGGLHRAAR